MPMIDVVGVSHRFEGRPGASDVLIDVTVSMSEHRIGIIGANGSGKSTFARLVNGLVIPSKGSVLVDGLATSQHGREIRTRVGFCFTDPDTQIVMPTVREDVAFSLRSSGLSAQEAASRVDDTLNRFRLAGLADHPSHLLSGGQKQLLALAAVLVREPEVVVMDEPTTLLDLRNTRMFGEVMATLAPQVLLVTHDLDLLVGFDRVLVFDEGRLVCDDEPSSAVSFYRSIAT